MYNKLELSLSYALSCTVMVFDILNMIRVRSAAMFVVYNRCQKFVFRRFQNVIT